MTIPLFDVQCGCGGTAPGTREALAPALLVEQMTRADIARALVRRVPAGMEIDLPDSNRRLYDDCTAHVGFVPCPAVAPTAGSDIPTEPEQAADAIAHGAGAVTIRPRMDYWTVSPWCADPLFRALQERRLPVYCQNGEITYDELAALAERYPALPFILAGVDYRQQRQLFPLLQGFPNIYLSIGSNNIVHRGIEQCVAGVGAGRLLFGSGFPDVDVFAHVSSLMYAEISDEDKASIGAGNLDRLIMEVQR